MGMIVLITVSAPATATPLGLSKLLLLRALSYIIYGKKSVICNKGDRLLPENLEIPLNTLNKYKNLKHLICERVYRRMKRRDPYFDPAANFLERFALNDYFFLKELVAEPRLQYSPPRLS